MKILKGRGREHEASAYNRRKYEDLQPLKDFERKKKARQRDDKNQVDRLKHFQETTMFGPLFICISCHGKMFRNRFSAAGNK